MCSFCVGIFDGFKFEPLLSAQPPQVKGVYVLRIKERGLAPSVIVEKIELVLGKMQWPSLDVVVRSNLKLLTKIGNCPTIYIGGAGVYRDSQNTLWGRYNEFSGRHTIMYCLWLLVYFGWRLEYGWVEDIHPKEREKELKREYVARHDHQLPALVTR